MASSRVFFMACLLIFLVLFDPHVVDSRPPAAEAGKGRSLLSAIGNVYARALGLLPSLASFLLSSIFSTTPPPPPPSAAAASVSSCSTDFGSHCSSECARRCRLSSRVNRCKRACGTCCYRCNCVPPGTYGNKEVCPCYANMTTHGGRPKCP